MNALKNLAKVCQAKGITMVFSHVNEQPMRVIEYGLAPLLSQKVDKWDENQFKTWCDYHYSVCREQSVLGASNHVIIIGRK